MSNEESEKVTKDELRELDKSQIIWVTVRSVGFIPSVEGRLLGLQTGE